MFKRILLPLDGSPLAEQAIPYAVAQAERFGAEIILLRVVEPLRGAPGASTSVMNSVERRLGGIARQYLDEIAGGLQAQGLGVRTVVASGRPHEEIVRFAEENQADLIVICQHGQSGLSRWLMGTVADHVVRGATIPVLLVQASRQKS